MAWQPVNFNLPAEWEWEWEVIQVCRVGSGWRHAYGTNFLIYYPPCWERKQHCNLYMYLQISPHPPREHFKLYANLPVLLKDKTQSLWENLGGGTNRHLSVAENANSHQSRKEQLCKLLLHLHSALKCKSLRVSLKRRMEVSEMINKKGGAVSDEVYHSRCYFVWRGLSSEKQRLV